MDNVDPLNTTEPEAQHTSVVSGNRYLVKHTSQLNKGEVTKAESEAKKPEQGRVWWIAVGKDLDPQNFKKDHYQSVLVHIFGYGLGSDNSNLGLRSCDNTVVLARAFEVEKSTAEEMQGVQIGTWEEAPLYSCVFEKEVDRTLQLDQEWELLKQSFQYEELPLAYYWYRETGKFPAKAGRHPPPSRALEVVQSLNN